MIGAAAAFLMLLGQAAGRAPERPQAPPGFETLAKNAVEARDANRLDEALVLYRRALKLKPDWGDGLWSYGSITYDKDDYASCAPAFRRLAVLKPDDAPAWTMSGLCEYGLRRYESALTSLVQAERLGFKEIPELARAARLHLALLLTRAGDFERAIVVLTGIAAPDKKRADIVAACGVAGLRRPWLPFEVPEKDRDMAFRLGDAMTDVMQLEPKSAAEKFEALLKDYPAEPNIHFRFGAFLMQQTPERGIEEIKKALDLDPAYVPALVSLAVIHLKREEVDTARQYAEKAVKTDAGDFSTHIALGRVLLAANDAAGAARELETAVKLAPASPEARFSLASAYTRLGRKSDAARELSEFQRLRKLVDSTKPI